MMKIRVGVFFGGKSVEHEVSVISALQAIASIPADKYEVIPVYITKENEFYTSFECSCIEEYSNIPALIKKSTRCILMNVDGRVKLMRYPFKKSGASVISEIDVAFPIVHGTNVEDGTLQGYLKLTGVPYVGCDVTASAVGMDKYVMKTVLKDNGIPVLDCIRFISSDFSDPEGVIKRCEEKIGYPVVVKPVNLGSSVGISLASDKDELFDSLENAFRYATVVLVEKAITDLTEINCSVLGNSECAEASELEQPISFGKILDYTAKYQKGSLSQEEAAELKKGIDDIINNPMDIKNELADDASIVVSDDGRIVRKGESVLKYDYDTALQKFDAAKLSRIKTARPAKAAAGMASLSRLIPPNMTEETRAYIRSLAVKAYTVLGCNGLSRIDFMIDRSTNKVYLNEINTIPGSLSFYLWAPLGVKYPVVLDAMIELALRRTREEEAIEFSFDSDILRNFASKGSKGSKGSKTGSAGKLGGAKQGSKL